MSAGMRLLLVDATNVLIRCASVPNLSAAEALANAVGITRRAIRTVEATHVIACIDAFGSSMRRDVYPQYKADRTLDTAPWIEAGTEAFLDAGIYVAGAPGFEADDVIATLELRARERAEVAVLSGDSDLLALAGERTAVWSFEKGIPGGIARRSSAWICEKYGIPSPSHLTLWKALVGEKGDNVPGLPGVGPVKASRMIAEFGDYQTMRKLGALGEHAAWIEKAIMLLTLYNFAPVPAISPAEASVRRVLFGRAA